MVTRNGNRVEFGHAFGGVSNDIRNNTHGRLRRIDVRISHHKLLQNIILNGALKLRQLHALLLSSYNVECQNGQHGSIHRHTDRHLVQGYPLKQALHILNRINRNSRHPNVTRYPRVITVVSSVRCQIKSHTQPLLTCSEVRSIKCIRRFGSRKTSILPNRPRPRCIHRGIRAAQIWRLAWAKSFMTKWNLLAIYVYVFRHRN